MSIVLKLQKKCLDKNEDLQSLLLEALVISTKLKLNDFKEWINNELKGYKENIPNYRNVQIILKFFNRYNGWQPAVVKNKEMSEKLSNSSIGQPISELENLLSSDNSDFQLFLSPEEISILMNFFSTNSQPAKFVNKVQIFGITQQVRNLLLEWTLKLEEDNILGNDDLIFSEEEKKAAESVHIENFHGVMGNVNKVANMSTGANSTNIYNENNISNEIDKLITDIKKLGLQNQKQVIIDLEESKNDNEKAKSVLGGLLGRGAEVASISSAIIGILGLL